MAALALLPAGAHADLMFEHGGTHLQVSRVACQLERRRRRRRDHELGRDQGYLARIDSNAENDAILATVSAHLSPSQLANTIPNDGSEAAFVWLGGSDADSRVNGLDE